MTAIMMASMGSAAVTTVANDTTITVGQDLWFSAGTSDDYSAFGFNGASSDPLSLGQFGSFAAGGATYVDGSATTRTINSVYYSEDTGGAASSTQEDSIFFGIIGTSIPDTDVTFREIVYNGVTYTRASRSSYDASIGGACTYWRWNNVNPDGPTFGVRTFQVLL